MTIYSQLASAIEDRRNIRVVYDGYTRDCSPHAIGLKNGEPHCLVYQFAGETSDGPVEKESEDNWRCLVLLKIERLDFIGGDWHTSPNAENLSSCIDEYDVEV